MDPYLPLPNYEQPGQNYAGPAQESASEMEELRKLRTKINQLNKRNEELKKINEDNKKNIPGFEKEFSDFKIQTAKERIANAEAQDKLRRDLYNSGVTPVPPNQQLTAVERDQLDFFQKSPGIGMLFLSSAFLISGTDLGGEVSSAIVGRLNDMQKNTEDSNGQQENSEGSKNEPEGGRSCEPPAPIGAAYKRLKIVLTILMPIILLAVQFAYIFFIFFEAYTAYMALETDYDKLCPGYDVPRNSRADPPFGADQQVRILVSFIGAFYVFRNILQLIDFQRALLGNVTSTNPTKPPVPGNAKATQGDSPEVKAHTMAMFVYQISGDPDAAKEKLKLKTASKKQENEPKADTSLWSVQEISQSRFYWIFCIDIFLNLTIVFLVLMSNLYIVFVAGGGAQDCLTKVVILNFILDQQATFKREIFTGTTGRVVLSALRKAYEIGAPKPELEPNFKLDEMVMEAASKELEIKTHNKDEHFVHSSILVEFSKLVARSPGPPADDREKLQKLRTDVDSFKKAVNKFEEKLRKFREGNEGKNTFWKSRFAVLILFLGLFPVWLSASFVIYAPICKPGISNVVALGKTERSDLPTIGFGVRN